MGDRGREELKGGCQALSHLNCSEFQALAQRPLVALLIAPGKTVSVPAPCSSVRRWEEVRNSPSHSPRVKGSPARLTPHDLMGQRRVCGRGWERLGTLAASSLCVKVPLLSRVPRLASGSIGPCQHADSASPWLSLTRFQQKSLAFLTFGLWQVRVSRTPSTTGANLGEK